MNKLKSWCDRKGFYYSDKTFGVSYFNDHSLDLHFEGVMFSFGIDKEDYKAYQEIKKYCDRYGYTIISGGGFPGVHYINVMRRDQWEQIRNYEKFSRESQKQCEKHIHFCRQYYGGTHKELNEELTGIMEYYEEEYKAFLAA